MPLRNLRKRAGLASAELHARAPILEQLALKRGQEGARHELTALKGRAAGAHLDLSAARRILQAREEFGDARATRIVEEVMARLRQKGETGSAQALDHELAFAIQRARAGKGKKS